MTSKKPFCQAPSGTLCQNKTNDKDFFPKKFEKTKKQTETETETIGILHHR